MQHCSYATLRGNPRHILGVSTLYKLSERVSGSVDAVASAIVLYNYIALII